MSPNMAMPRGTKPDRYIKVAQYQPVPNADNEARPEQERPIMDGDERRADRGARATRPRPRASAPAPTM
jgi:hypothetical protein